MKGNCYTPPRTDEVLSNSFATISALNTLSTNTTTSINNLMTTDQNLSNSIANLNLNNIAGVLDISKGGTSATDVYTANYYLQPVVHSGDYGTTAGTRNDGQFSCIKYGRLVRFLCRIIGGGSTNYSSSTYIPAGFRPCYRVRIPCTLINSNKMIGYGAVYIETNGDISFITSTSTDAEICCEGWWTVDY